jgi:heptosyltransferase-2
MTRLKINMPEQNTTTRHAPIFIRLPNWIGDVCMCLPVLDLLDKAGLSYIVCARGWAKSLLTGLKTAGFIEMTDSLKQNVRVLRQWRREHPTHQIGLLMPDSLSSALTFRLAGIQSAGWRDDGRSLLLKWGHHKPTESMHAVQAWFELAQRALNSWDIPARHIPLPHRLHLPITNEHKQAAAASLREAGLKAGEFVLIAPTATGQHRGLSKVWPHFDAFARILQNNRVKVAMCPPESEQAAANRAAPTVDLLRPLDLGGFCALTRMAKLVICNDSGVAHLCAAAGAKQVTLFGVTEMERTGPWSPESCNLGQNGRWVTTGEVVTRTQQLLSV